MNSLERALSKTIGLFFAVWPQPRPSDEKLAQTRLVAHRGVHEDGLAAENTLPAFQLVQKNGIWGAEFDVRFTRDETPVVHHDLDCGRCFARPDLVIAEIDFATLRREIPAIPTLAEVLALLGGQTHMMIEIKDDLSRAPERVARLKDLLQHLKPVVDYHFLSLVPEQLEALTFVSKATFMDVFWLETEPILRKNRELGHGLVAGYFLFLSDRSIRALHEQGRQVGLGFLDSRNSLYRELNRGADFIFTNHPLRLKSYMNNK